MMDYDTVKDELLAVTDSALKYGKSLNADAEIEVGVFYSHEMSAEITQGIVSAKDGIVAGCSARVALGKRIGFASASGITKNRVDLVIFEALSIASGVTVEDNRFQGFCDPAGRGKEGAFDKEILALGTDDLIRFSEEMITEAKTVDERAKIFSAEAAASWGAYALGNTRGILEATRFGHNMVSVNVQAMVGEERRGSFGFDVARDRIVKTEGLGRDAAQRAVNLLGAEKLDFTGALPTVWKPIAASTYIASSLARSTLGDAVVDGVSPLCDHLGNEIAVKSLTVYDDGQNPNYLGTMAIDAEGHPQRRNTVIEDGVLKGFLFDSYYARANGVEPTGNASRGGGIFGGSIPYEVPPSVGAKHLEVVGGDRSLDDLISSIDGKALLIDDFPLGIFHTDVATGEFAVVASSVYLIENGEIKHSVQPVSVAGNFYEGYKKIIAMGNDVEVLPWSVSVGSLVFDGFTITG
ncbi:MAG: TldD/PmbA family protein [Candidatus Thorarchaeota archaeon]|nr:TldD/PmbA family protein [Candidatus Thorarchaeota archaeon]